MCPPGAIFGSLADWLISGVMELTDYEFRKFVDSGQQSVAEYDSRT
jgi:hypothetical protein